MGNKPSTNFGHGQSMDGWYGFEQNSSWTITFL